MPDLSSLTQDVRDLANLARRSNPVPTDFDNAHRLHNLTPSALVPHRKPPIPKAKRLPTWTALLPEDTTAPTLPILDAELDGTSEKASKTFIPSSFPTFPSLHTYKRTLVPVESVMEHDDAAVKPDTQSQTLAVAGSQPLEQGQQTQRPLAPDEIPRGDPKKMREAAAKEAKQAEAALRGISQATKIAKQKERWSTAQLGPMRKERHNLLGALIKDLTTEEPRVKGADAAAPGVQKRIEIADYSMVVNAEKQYYRREVPRKMARKSGGEGVKGKG